ncbi:MAG: hypothetical protein ABIL76_08195 [candidate division WOR-3 bacterium]
MFVKIKKLNEFGEGIGYSSNGKFKLKHVLPGEIVNLENLTVKKPSRYRILPTCKFYYHCNGCSLQIANYEYQIQLKTKFLKSVLNKLNLNPIFETFEKSKPFNYLNTYDKNYYNLKVDSCPLVYEEINEILSILPNSLIIKGSQRLKSFLVYIEHYKGLSTSFLRDVFNLNENLAGIILKEERNDRVLYGNNYYKEKILSKTIKINLFSDFENNVEIFEKKVSFLRNLIISNGFKKIIIYKAEFYPLFLFDILSYCLCSERNGYNRSDLEELFKIYDVFNCDILSVKLKSIIETKEKFDLLILNKPFIKNIKLLKLNEIKNVVIILENIRKLKSILKIMKNFNYELVLLKPFDSYPQIFNFDLILFFTRE